MRKMPPAIIVLFILFLLGFGKDVELIVRFPTSADYIVFNAAGMAYLFFILIIAIASLDGLTLWFLMRPRAMGLRIAIASVAFSMIENVIACALVMRDMDAARNAYVLSRQARGMLVRQDALDFMFSSTAVSLTLAAALAFELILVALLVWKREYFLGTADSGPEYSG